MKDQSLNGTFLTVVKFDRGDSQLSFSPPGRPGFAPPPGSPGCWHTAPSLTADCSGYWCCPPYRNQEKNQGTHQQGSFSQTGTKVCVFYNLIMLLINLNKIEILQQINPILLVFYGRGGEGFDWKQPPGVFTLILLQYFDKYCPCLSFFSGPNHRASEVKQQWKRVKIIYRPSW